MHKNYLRFALLVVLILLARLPKLAQRLVSTPSGEEVLTFHDPESLLSVGERLPLSCVDIYALELISGISDALAEELLAARPRITTAVQSGLSERSALQLTKGVGQLNSGKLLRFIKILGECPDINDEREGPPTPHPALQWNPQTAKTVD